MGEKHLDVDLEEIQRELFDLEIDPEQRFHLSINFDNGMLDVYNNLRSIDLHNLFFKVQAVHGITVGISIDVDYVPNDINDKLYFVVANYYLDFRTTKQGNVGDFIVLSNFCDTLDMDVSISFLYNDNLDFSTI